MKMTTNAINSIKNVQTMKVQAQKPAFGQNAPQKQDSEDKTGLIVAGLAAAAAIGAATVMIIKGRGSRVITEGLQTGAGKPANMAQEAAQASTGKGGSVVQETTATVATKEQPTAQNVAQDVAETVSNKNAQESASNVIPVAEKANRSYGELTRIEALEKRVMAIGADGKPTFDALQAQKLLKVNELSEEGWTKVLKTVIPEEEHELLQFCQKGLKSPIWKVADTSVSDYIESVHLGRAFLKELFGDDYCKIFKKDFLLVQDKKVGELTVGDLKDYLSEKYLKEVVPSGITDRSQKLVDIIPKFREFDPNKTFLEQDSMKEYAEIINMLSK